MSSQFLNIINTYIRDLIKLLDSARRGVVDRDVVLRALDELENRVDEIISSLAPERITDERFSAASTEIRELSEKFKELRSLVINGKYSRALSLISDVHESVRKAFRILQLIKAGAPVPVIIQQSPSSPLFPPEVILNVNPDALQVYNVLVRRGEISFKDLINELKIDVSRINSAIRTLQDLGYVRVYLLPDGTPVLRVVR